MFDLSPLPMWIYEITEAYQDKTSGPHIVYVNKAFNGMTGFAAEDVLGKTTAILHGSNPDKEELERLKTALQNLEPCEITILCYKKNGDEFWMSISLSPVSEEKGEFIHWLAIGRDITLQKKEAIQKRLLGEISRMFNRETPLGTTMDNVLQHLVRFGDFDLAEAWVVSTDKSKLNLISCFPTNGYSKSVIPDTRPVKSLNCGEGLPGSVWLNREVRIWENMDRDGRFVGKDAAGTSGIKSALGLPLIQNGELVGVLLFFSSHNRSKLEYYRGIFRDLESFLGAEIKRKQLEEDLNQIFKTSPDVICISGADGYLKRINPAACTLLGYTESELLDKPLMELIHPEDRIHTNEKEEQLTLGKSTQRFENRYIKKSGEVIWLAWTSTPSSEEGLIFGIAKNITKQKNLQNLLDSATDLARIGGWEVDLIKNTLFWSSITCEIHEVEGHYEPDLEDAINFYREDVRPLVRQRIEESIQNGKPWDFELPIITAKGNERWVRSIGQCDFRDGISVRLYGSFQDIHQRKIAELAFQKAYDEKNTILESIGDAFFAVDIDWTVTYWNKLAELNLGKKREEVVGRNLWAVYEDAVHLDFYTQYHKAMDSGKIVNFEEYYPAVRKWFEVSAYPSSSGLSVYFKDVSDRKQAELKLKRSNERFEKVAQATNDAIWDWDILNDTLSWGGGYKTLFGYDVGKITPTLATWLNYIHPDDLETVVASFHRMLGEPDSFNWNQEYRFQKANGHFSYVIDRGVVIRDEKDEPIRMVGAMTDMTERKNFEVSLKQLNATLDVRAKELAVSNAELEQFAYVASHDLQEPLRMITGFLSQLEKHYKDQLDEKAHKYIYFAVDGAKRMRQIILDLLDFSRIGKQDNEKEMLDLKDLVNEVCLLQRKSMEEKSAHIITRSLPVIHHFKAPLTQVFQNLINNALKYSRENIPPRVEIAAEESGTHWTFTVKDNGIGISTDYYDKIFIIFQRLHAKEEYNGTGMGLAIVKKIVENMGGKIWLTSVEGEGTTFYFTLLK